MEIRLECRDAAYDAVILYWTVDKEAHERVADFYYVVEISESPNGPWSPLFNPPISAFGYIDSQTQRGMVDQRIYYRVVARNKTGQMFTSDPICLFEEDTNYITQYISDVEEKYMLQRFNGNEFLHFSRRKFGDRCHYCYDKVERKSIKPKCPYCYGTTYEGGFFLPEKIYINTDIKPKILDKNEYGVTEHNVLNGWTSNRVIIEDLDMVVSLNKQMNRYVINQVLPSGIHGSVTRQPLVMAQLKVDHPFQLLKIDVTKFPLEEHSIFRRAWKEVS